MALEQRLNLKLSQKLVMTQSLQQAIKLLQMSRLELVESVQQELLENPVLEEAAEYDDDVSKNELERIKTWNFRLGLVVILLVFVWLATVKRYEKEVRYLEKSHFGASVKLGEVLLKSLEQETVYVDFLVQEGIISPIELEAVREQKEQAIASQQRRVAELKARYGI